MLRFFVVGVVIASYVSVLVGEGPPVTEECLGCICEAVSGCNLKHGCIAGACGPFQITRDYWVEAGKITINEGHANEKRNWEECSCNFKCASQTVQAYMVKNGTKDCNGDGKINCDDFVTVHWAGFNCWHEQVLDSYKQAYLKCKGTRLL